VTGHELPVRPEERMCKVDFGWLTVAFSAIGTLTRTPAPSPMQEPLCYRHFLHVLGRHPFRQITENISAFLAFLPTHLPT